MKIGIMGLPNVGKSSLFNFLTQGHVQVAKFPFTTIDRNIGMVTISDKRLEKIVEITKAPKMKYGGIEFIDIAGLIKGASRGDGLGNKFLAHIRDVDLMIHMLRCFEDPDIPHTNIQIRPKFDYEIVRTELFLADLGVVERRIDKIKKKAECREEFENLERIRDSLNKGQIPADPIKDLPLLSTKKELIVLNFDEDGKSQVDIEGIEAYKISIKLEEDINSFSDEEKQSLRKDAGLNPAGLAGLLKYCMDRLSIILFYTIKGDETRAWPIKKGSNILEAAGLIHSDIREGFIKAEILNWQDFISTGGFGPAQQKGVTRIEGKEYIVKDGDIILVKFRK
jgi:GTP-binding protein YchF